MEKEVFIDDDDDDARGVQDWFEINLVVPR